MLMIVALCGVLILGSNASYAAEKSTLLVGNQRLRQKRSGGDGDGRIYGEREGEITHNIGPKNNIHDLDEPKVGLHNIDANRHYVVKRSDYVDSTEEGSGEAVSGEISTESIKSEKNGDNANMTSTELSGTQTSHENHPQQKRFFTNIVKATPEFIPDDDSFDNLKGRTYADTDEKFKEEIKKKLPKIDHHSTTQGPECPPDNPEWHCFDKSSECTDIGGVVVVEHHCTIPHRRRICCYLQNSPTPTIVVSPRV